MELSSEIRGRPIKLQELERQTVFQFLEAQASNQPDQEAFVLYDQDCNRFSLTYRDWHNQSHALANALIEKGLGSDDTVIYISPNNLEYPVDIMALFKTGANVIALQQGYDGDSIIECLLKFECSVFMYHLDDKHPTQASMMQEVTKQFCQQSSNIKAVIAPASGAENIDFSRRVYSYTDLLSLGQSLSMSDMNMITSRVHPDDPALAQETSGSTGYPKLCQFSHLTLVLAALGTARIIGVDTASRIFLDLPFSWCSGMWAGINMAACTGATLICVHPTLTLTRRLTDFALKVLQDEKCSKAFFLPYLIYDINELGPLMLKYNLECLQRVLTGSQPVPLDVMTKLFTLLPNTEVFLAYGSTETALVASQKLGKDSLGASMYGWMEVLDGVELTIRDDEGRVVSKGTIGEVWFD